MARLALRAGLRANAAGRLGAAPDKPVNDAVLSCTEVGAGGAPLCSRLLMMSLPGADPTEPASSVVLSPVDVYPALTADSLDSLKATFASDVPAIYPRWQRRTST